MLPGTAGGGQGWMQSLAWSLGGCEEEILLILGVSLLAVPTGGVSTVPPQLALLYEEVLYTIHHRLGKPEQQHVGDSQELFSYVQKVCPLPDRGPKTWPLACPSPQLQGVVGVCYAPSSVSF